MGRSGPNCLVEVGQRHAPGLADRGRAAGHGHRPQVGDSLVAVRRRPPGSRRPTGCRRCPSPSRRTSRRWPGRDGQCRSGRTPGGRDGAALPAGARGRCWPRTWWTGTRGGGHAPAVSARPGSTRADRPPRSRRRPAQPDVRGRRGAPTLWASARRARQTVLLSSAPTASTAGTVAVQPHGAGGVAPGPSQQLEVTRHDMTDRVIGPALDHPIMAPAPRRRCRRVRRSPGRRR